LAGLLLAHQVSDVQLEQGPPVLGHALVGRARRVVAMEHAGAVAIERHGLAVLFEVAPRRLEITEGRLGRGEVQGHQPAGGVIDKHQQRAGQRALLKPPMIAAVDLDQLGQARSTIPRLVDPGRTLLARHPQARFSHQAPHGFLC